MVLPKAAGKSRAGSLLVLVILLFGVGAAIVAISYQRTQTQNCLKFYGPKVSRHITKAPVVELWKLSPDHSTRHLIAVQKCEVTNAQGIVHLRRGFVEDAGFRWEIMGPASRLPIEIWDYAFVFRDPELDEQTAICVNLDVQGGWMTVVGRPGRVALGRLGKGLQDWIQDVNPVHE
ncbi:MAG: hypothetical protein ABGW78_16770 [Pirellulales bacterium]